MKNRMVLLFAISALVMTGSAAIRFQAPSDVLLKGNGSKRSGFVLSQISDMRQVYCDLDTLRDRENERCFLDSKFENGIEKHLIRPTLRYVAFFSPLDLPTGTGGDKFESSKKMLSFKVVFPVQ
jgi:hypothetical protein